jgi:putative ABC transport system substrate-binding protein
LVVLLLPDRRFIGQDARIRRPEGQSIIRGSRVVRIGRIVLLAALGILGMAHFVAAQPATRTVTIGLLAVAGIEGPAPAFVEALSRLGYHDGQNLAILFRSARDSHAELPKLAVELVSLEPDVLVAMGTPPSLALKEATASIPIVMLNTGNPVATGLVQSLARPGGNVTGTSNAVEEWAAKRLQMVTEMLPGIRCMLYLRNPENPSIMLSGSLVRAREKLNIELDTIDAATPEQLDRALAAPFDERCKAALFLPLDGLFVARRAQIAEFALRQKIALFAPFRADAEAGALVAYGVDIDDQWRIGAAYVDKILKGAKPADLPVQEPTKFDLVVNARTARTLGLTIPQWMLVNADKVIE